MWVDVEGLPLSACSKESFRKIISKWGSIAQLDDDLREDVYKNRIYIMYLFKVLFWRWSKFVWMGLYTGLELKKLRSGLFTLYMISLNLIWRKVNYKIIKKMKKILNLYMVKKDVSSNSFCIYDAIEKMKADEVNNDIPRGFNSWGNGKKVRNFKDGFEGQNRYTVTENLFYFTSPNLGDE